MKSLLVLVVVLMSFCTRLTYDTTRTYQSKSSYSGNYKDSVLPVPKINYTGLISLVSEYYDSLVALNKICQWQFVDMIKYPYYCAQSLYLTRTVNVEVDTIGMDQYVDKTRIVHVRVATVVSFTRPIHPIHTQTYWMNYYMYDAYSSQWVLEKPPVKTDIQLIRSYFICK
jgi:hypothetical protein